MTRSTRYTGTCAVWPTSEPGHERLAEDFGSDTRSPPQKRAGALGTGTLGHWRFLSSTGNNGHMASYVGAERASSTDPRDWGRALAVALDRLLEAARTDGRYAQHEHLCGVDLVLRIEEDGDGAKVTVRWVPEDNDLDEPEKLAG